MKFEKISFSVIGGDRRQVKLCNYLISHGFPVSMFGFSNIEINPLVKQCSTLSEAVKDANIVIGPIPCSQNDKDLFTRYYHEKVTVEEVFKAMNTRQIFMAGRLTEKIQKLLTEYDLTYIDLLERDDMAIRNAMATKVGITGGVDAALGLGASSPSRFSWLRQQRKLDGLLAPRPLRLMLPMPSAGKLSEASLFLA